MNNCSFTGSFGKDPDMRYAPSGSAVLRFSIAVDSGFGEHKRTDWVPMVAFGKTAEHISQFCQKGTMVEITGEYQTSTYEKDGEKQYSHNFIVNRWKTLARGRKRTETGEAQSGDFSDTDTGAEEEFPF